MPCPTVRMQQHGVMQGLYCVYCQKPDLAVRSTCNMFGGILLMPYESTFAQVCPGSIYKTLGHSINPATSFYVGKADPDLLRVQPVGSHVQTSWNESTTFLDYYHNPCYESCN